MESHGQEAEIGHGSSLVHSAKRSNSTTILVEWMDQPPRQSADVELVGQREFRKL